MLSRTQDYPSLKMLKKGRVVNHPSGSPLKSCAGPQRLLSTGAVLLLQASTKLLSRRDKELQELQGQKSLFGPQP